MRLVGVGVVLLLLAVSVHAAFSTEQLKNAAIEAGKIPQVQPLLGSNALVLLNRQILYMYHEIIFRPLYNGLVGIMDLIPWIDVGIAVVIFTVIVKLILFPLSKASLLTQVKMKEIA